MGPLVDYLVTYARPALEDSRSEEFSNWLERLFGSKTPERPLWVTGWMCQSFCLCCLRKKSCWLYVLWMIIRIYNQMQDGTLVNLPMLV